MAAMLLPDSHPALNEVFSSRGLELVSWAETPAAEVIRVMLKYGADPNWAPDMRRSPLSRAISSGLADCVELLLDAGVNPWTSVQSREYYIKLAHDEADDFEKYFDFSNIFDHLSWQAKVSYSFVGNRSGVQGWETTTRVFINRDELPMSTYRSLARRYIEFRRNEYRRIIEMIEP